jgi:hypothetical protein
MYNNVQHLTKNLLARWIDCLVNSEYIKDFSTNFILHLRIKCSILKIFFLFFEEVFSLQSFFV